MASRSSRSATPCVMLISWSNPMTRRTTGAEDGEAKATSQIDWMALHHEMEILSRALERGWHPDAEETNRILAKRAQELARRPSTPGGAGDIIEYLSFMIGQERYG